MSIQVHSSGTSPKLQTKTITPNNSVQNIYSDTRYDGLDKVIVEAIPQGYYQMSTQKYTYSDMTKWSYEYDNDYYTNNGYLYSYDINNISPPVNSNLIKFVEPCVILNGDIYGYGLSGYGYYANAQKSYGNRISYQGRFFYEEEKTNYTLINKLCAVCAVFCLNGADDLSTWRISFLLDKN